MTENEKPFDNMILEEFDAASNHPYECKCDLCKRWWAELPEEE